MAKLRTPKRSRRDRDYDRYESQSHKTKCKKCGKEIYTMTERGKKDAMCVGCGLRDLMTSDPNERMREAIQKDFKAGRIGKSEAAKMMKKYAGKAKR